MDSPGGDLTPKCCTVHSSPSVQAGPERATRETPIGIPAVLRDAIGAGSSTEMIASPQRYANRSAASPRRIHREVSAGDEGAAVRRRRVFIVDDHQFFVAGLSSLINHAPDLEVCGSAPDGRRVVSEVKRLRPDLVLMDVMLPGTDGITVARSLRRILGRVPILFISSLASSRVREQAQQLGSFGVLDKTQEPNRLLEGIRRALGI